MSFRRSSDPNLSIEGNRTLLLVVTSYEFISRLLVVCSFPHSISLGLSPSLKTLMWRTKWWVIETWLIMISANIEVNNAHLAKTCKHFYGHFLVLIVIKVSRGIICTCWKGTWKHMIDLCHSRMSSYVSWWHYHNTTSHHS